MAERFTIESEKQLVAFKVGREEFGVDVLRVEGVIAMVEITRMPRAPEFVEGIINLRGQIISVVDLARRLGIDGSPEGPSTRIVVVESEDVKVGLIVDSPQVIHIDPEEIEPAPALAGGELETTFIRGVVKLGDRLLILLDVDRVLTDEERIDVEAIERLRAETAEE